MRLIIALSPSSNAGAARATLLRQQCGGIAIFARQTLGRAVDADLPRRKKAAPCRGRPSPIPIAGSTSAPWRPWRRPGGAFASSSGILRTTRPSVTAWMLSSPTARAFHRDRGSRRCRRTARTKAIAATSPRCSPSDRRRRAHPRVGRLHLRADVDVEIDAGSLHVAHPEL